MKKVNSFLFYLFVAIVFYLLFFWGMDRALGQLDYKMCKQIPTEVRTTDCSERNYE